MSAEPADAAIRLLIHSDAHSVRAALLDLFAARPLGHLPDVERDAAELVLAEVLNNIVEHADVPTQGTIELTIRPSRHGLDCTVVDGGAPMPGDGPPAERMPNLSATRDPPEGGFGWPLIRLLASDLAYRRIGDRNELTFRLSPG